MEKNTVIAIILATIIITAGMFITQTLNNKNAPPSALSAENGEEAGTKFQENESQADSGDASSSGSVSALPDQDFELKTIVEETDYFQIVFSTAGAVATEINLLAELDDGKPISMVMDGESGVGTFNMAFGGTEEDYLTEIFDHKREVYGKEIIHNFTRDFSKNGQTFTLSKIYRIIPGEYLVELIVKFNTSDGKALSLSGGNDSAYTLTYGPQIGPEFDKIDGRNEIRNNVTWGPSPRNGKLKRSVHKHRSQFVQLSDTTVHWAGIIGKYFAVVMYPGSGDAVISWDNRMADGQDQASRMHISRPNRWQSLIEDTYRFYIGPLNRADLSRYDRAEDNAFGASGMGLQNAPRSSTWLGWLESILRVLLEFFYRLTPNYGIAIILLTILIKAILYPFTHKSYESTSKMQAIQPKIKELQQQYKGEPQKLNIKTAELYKSEGVNPMGGCLPMLFQFPIFIALYGLLNRYFPLHGAVFIPGWITDLSAPEFVGNVFEKPLNLLIIDIPAIRILPVLYLGGQLLMTRVTQQGSAGAQTGMQQKMLTLGMPIIFFFILYNMPSGLLLYWIAMNFITIGQQLFTNYFKKRKSSGGVM